MANLSLGHLPHLLCVLDFENRFKQVNTAWQHNLGITADNLLTTTFAHWIHPDDLAATQNSLSQLYSGKREWVMFETRWHDLAMNYHQLLWVATASLTGRLIDAVGLEVSKSKSVTPRVHPSTDFIVCY